MRIPKKGVTTPPTQKARAKLPKDADATTRSAAASESASREPWALSDQTYQQLFAAKTNSRAAKGPVPARRTTARVQRAFADAFLDEAAPHKAPPMGDDS